MLQVGPMVFYRKYRPQKIDELDLKTVREYLTAILSSTDIPHAFLFTGPKGLGKTSAARIVAKAVNCEMKHLASSSSSKKSNTKSSDINADLEPCNQCSACVSITNGSNIDVIEIDAASNRGIDEIRSLREKVKYASAQLKKKVYIIDEVHMLTPEAFNALLKTLEEPPGHVLFILCTTEFWKLPPTIISRTYQVKFEKPHKDELLRSLQRIFKGEELEINDEVLSEVYKLSEGSFRDAAKIIEELSVSTKDKKITKEMLEDIFKSESIEKSARNFIKYLFEKNAKAGLELLEQLAGQAIDFRLVCTQIIEILRRMLLIQAGLDKQSIDIDIPRTEEGVISELLDDLQKAYSDMKFSPIVQLPLELVVVKWTVIKQDQRLNIKDKQSLLSRKLESQNEKEVIENNNENKKTSLKVFSSGVTRANVNPKESDELLKKLIDVVKKDNHSLAGILRSCKIGNITSKSFELITPYKFHKNKLIEEKSQNIIESRSLEVFGHKLSVILLDQQSN